MIRLPGKHENSARYYYDGHVYYNDPRGAGTTFRCSKRNQLGCPAIICVDNFNDWINEEHRVINDHFDPGDPLYVLKDRFSEELKLLAREPEESFMDIYNTVLDKEESVLHRLIFIYCFYWSSNMTNNIL